MKIFVLAILVAGFSVHGAEKSALALQATIPLPGVEGRFDHFAADVKGARLFVAALGNNSVEAVDLAARKRLWSAGAQQKPCGVLFLSESNSVAVANGGDGTLRFLNASDGHPLGQVGGLDDADNLRRDTRTGDIWLGFGEGTLAVWPPANLRPAARVSFRGHPEAFQLETGGPRLFVNVPDAHEVLVLDRAQAAIAARWPLSGLAANFPLALDEKNQRLFSVCRRPACLAVLDLSTGRVVATVPCVGDADDVFYDAQRRQIYISGGEGFLDVVEQLDANTYLRREHVPTAAGARTSHFIPERDELCLAVPLRGAQPAELRIYRVR